MVVPSHVPTSKCLAQCTEFLDGLREQTVLKVRDSGHVYTDDTTLPMQNHEPSRSETCEATSGVMIRTTLIDLRCASTRLAGPIERRVGCAATQG